MNATDLLTIDAWTDDLDDSIHGNATALTSMPDMAGVRFGASHPLAFQMSYMGARLGWHGTVGEFSPSTLVECSR